MVGPHTGRRTWTGEEEDDVADPWVIVGTVTGGLGAVAGVAGLGIARCSARSSAKSTGASVAAAGAAREFADIAATVWGPWRFRTSTAPPPTDAVCPPVLWPAATRWCSPWTPRPYRTGPTPTTGYTATPTRRYA